jgi:hypothetical protein
MCHHHEARDWDEITARLREYGREEELATEDADADTDDPDGEELDPEPVATPADD